MGYDIEKQKDYLTTYDSETFAYRTHRQYVQYYIFTNRNMVYNK